MVSDLVSVRPSPQYNAKDSVKFVSDSSENFSSASDVRPTAAATAAAVAQFTEHEVQRGDWLYDIGRRHNVDLRSLLKANPNLINPDSIHVGSRIRIPQVSSSSNVCIPPVSVRQPITQTRNAREATASTVKDSSFSSQAENLTLSKIFMLLGSFLWRDRDRVHKVVDGDSLEWLAEKYGTTVSALRRLNNLQTDTIYTGSVLKIDRAHSRRLHGTYLGKKASFKERNGLLDGILETPLPIAGRKEPMPGPLKYVKVRYGDTLADIACANGLTIRELQKLNHLRDDAIFEGDHLVIASDPTSIDISDIRSGRRRTSRPLFSRHTSSLQGSSKYPVGGPALTFKARVASGGIKLEGRWKTKKKGFQQPRDKRFQFSSPLTDAFISSPFGWRWGAFHEGVDLAADKGSPILASNRGLVTFAGWSGGYGYLVAIQHEGGFVTRYAHCCAIHARVGQQVSRGQRVAAVGATGHATGPHLHFEVRRNGEALDPLKWVNL
ncbi:uncharacterized protein LOC112348924 [Selaginella moellendorffii]|uniref:uncharacterized protein LOC112348052 n=1 Tax=Selaginella moellendorffii TaxID=88036 RepID=UPI000D1C579E|nr:uncharacterized protein LOC112348052 [Selaginella moellendorffii]XP_024538073.1 uncharacterized protein LOC112348924 [Selaginella moellendorffii]|eukprot:XP_024535767.1 uncharacterized protein LOC112348052 [Selaginella moellendorffii]